MYTDVFECVFTHTKLTPYALCSQGDYFFFFLFQLDHELSEVKKEVNKQEKRTIALKERMKKMGTGGPAARRGPDEDEIFEDENNE